MRGLISLVRFLLSLIIYALWIYFFAILFGFKDASLVSEVTRWLDAPLGLLRPTVGGWIMNISVEPFKFMAFGVTLVPAATGILSVVFAFTGNDILPENLKFMDISSLDNSHIAAMDLSVVALIVLLAIVKMVLGMVQSSLTRGWWGLNFWFGALFI
ncbi:MAG: hypothetical protein LBD16_09375 [Oscillospiraceae bacterium]|jgi:hypothetical protein|nr:hypothetical protein [Oscillospiraceae bacterium]